MFNNILVPIDIAKESSWTTLFPIAIAQARQSEAKINVMTVLSLDFIKMMHLVQLDFGIKAYSEPKDFKNEYIKKMKERLQNLINKEIPKDIETECIVKDGKIYSEIITTSIKISADLIIIKASHQSKLKEYVLGGNSSQITRYAKCSVFVIR